MEKKYKAISTILTQEPRTEYDSETREKRYVIIDTESGEIVDDAQGYGYKIWRTYKNSFFFNGMGCQFAVCSPDSDMILIYNGDNQGNSQASHIIINSYFDLVENTAQEQALPENPEAQNLLNAETADLKLAVAQGDYVSDTQKDVDGVTYTGLDAYANATKWAKLHASTNFIFIDDL